MRQTLRWGATALLATAALAFRPAAAQEDAAAGGKERWEKSLEESLGQAEKLVTIDRTDAPVRDVLREMGEVGGMNLVVVPEITDDDRVTVQLKDVPWKRALELILDLTRPTPLAIEFEDVRTIKIGKPPRVTMMMKDANLIEVLQRLAALNNISIAISPKVQGKITFNLENVPWPKALDVVVRTAGYATVREGPQIIRVVEPSELTAQLETRIFQLQHIRPLSPFIPEIQSRFAPRRVSIKQGSGGAGGGSGGQVQPGIGKYAREFPFLEFLETVLSRDAAGKLIGQILYDPLTNTVIVTDTKPVLDRVDEIIQRLDVEQEQVMIDVKFIQTRNEDLLEYGVRYADGEDGGFSFRSKARDPNPAATAGAMTGGKVSTLPFGFGSETPPAQQTFLTQYQFLATLRLFKKDEYSRLIQSPTLTAVHNKPATIFVGEEIHFASAEAEATQSGGTTFTITEAANSPVDIGFQLMVIPHIVRATSKVEMTIIPSNTFLSGKSVEAQIVGFERFTIGGLGPGGADLSLDLPRVSSATVVTELVVDSGQTAVLGGLVVERKNNGKQRIPVLGDVPILGFLFTHKIESVTKDHLIIFLTPRIIRSSGPTLETLGANLGDRASDAEKTFERLGSPEWDRAVDAGMEKRGEDNAKEHEAIEQGPAPAEPAPAPAPAPSPEAAEGSPEGK